MRIYSMTATFGKLSRQTLSLEPGLNVIQAPNEWGKSTWCGFLVAMLYGIDTRQKNTANSLADKERFNPWSGEPMSGRIELRWNGKDITIERSTTGRIPLGDFRAYETATGLDVPELTAANCGQVLLGVEKSVFTRSGFIRLQDMPVTQDEALRRRLNNLVTTGDESGAADQLGKQLRDLKNSVRFNRGGLLPQAEAQRDQLREELEQKENLATQIRQLQQRKEQAEQILGALENHTVNLQYQAAQQGAAQIRSAGEACSRLEAELAELTEQCAQLPDMQQAQDAIREGQELLSRQRALLTSRQQLPTPPTQPAPAPMFEGMTPEEAITAAEADRSRCQQLEQSKSKGAKLPVIAGICGGALILALVICFALSVIPAMALYIGIALCAALCVAMIALSTTKVSRIRKELDSLSQKYPGIPAESWISHARKYLQEQEVYRIALEQHNTLCGDFNQTQQALDDRLSAYGDGIPAEERLSQWQSILQKHTLLADKRKELELANRHAQALQSVATTAPEPEFPDELELSAQETQTHIQALRFEMNQLQIKLGSCIGQAETLRPESALREQLDRCNKRIGRLEDYYRALELAQEVLHQAVSTLQRRFAPRISKKAQENFARLTGGRYQRLSLSDDLSLYTSAEDENTLHSALWRSDGTADQLYLSLRLAVAGEITPDAPLVLDDSLLRFDDDRLAAAMELLQEISQDKQILLFSCQSREQQWLSSH